MGRAIVWVYEGTGNGLPLWLWFSGISACHPRFPPSSTLLPNTTYTAVVEGIEEEDYVAVKDADGTPMATDYIFTFTTGGGGPGPL